MSQAPIDLLVPELFAGDGGIQCYSRQLIQALRQVLPRQPLRIFIHNDHPSHLNDLSWPGVEWYPASGSRLRLSLSLLRAARRERPQLLISTHPNYAPLQVLHRSWSGTPNWCSAHGIEVWSLNQGPKRWALKRLQLLLPVSRFTATSLKLQLGHDCPHLKILPNTFDSERFHPGRRPQKLLSRYRLAPEQPLIFSLSRLNSSDGYKNLDRLIEALPILLHQWPDLCLMLAGDGDDRSRLEDLARKLGVRSKVIFTGRLADGELADHLRLATVFALPSTGEGFGIVFLEALGCGRPVLAGNRDGSVDPLAQGRLGLLIDPLLPLAPPLASLLAGQGESLWFQPSELAAAVTKEFGFQAFSLRLKTLLSNLEKP